MLGEQLQAVEGCVRALQAVLAAPAAELEAQVRSLQESLDKYKRPWERIKEAAAREKAELTQQLTEEQRKQEEEEAELEQARRQVSRAAKEAKDREREESTEFFRGLFSLMSPDLASKKGLFEVWVRYYEARQRAEAAGEDPDAVTFPFEANQPITHMDEDGAEGEDDEEGQDE